MHSLAKDCGLNACLCCICECDMNENEMKKKMVNKWNEHNKTCIHTYYK